VQTVELQKLHIKVMDILRAHTVALSFVMSLDKANAVLWVLCSLMSKPDYQLR